MSAKETEAKEVKGIKMEEVEKHSSIDDLWLVIDGASRGPFPRRDKDFTVAALRSLTPPSPPHSIRRQSVRRDAVHGRPPGRRGDHAGRRG